MTTKSSGQRDVKHVVYRTVPVEGLNVFYREAGPHDAPAILLLHDFPSSSHMFRDLIPLLAQDFHLVAPDLPGFGAAAFQKHIPDAQVHLLETGHFALETHAAEIAERICEFLDRPAPANLTASATTGPPMKQRN